MLKTIITLINKINKFQLKTTTQKKILIAFKKLSIEKSYNLSVAIIKHVAMRLCKYVILFNDGCCYINKRIFIATKYLVK